MIFEVRKNNKSYIIERHTLPLIVLQMADWVMNLSEQKIIKDRGLPEKTIEDIGLVSTKELIKAMGIDPNSVPKFVYTKKKN